MRAESLVPRVRAGRPVKRLNVVLNVGETDAELAYIAGFRNTEVLPDCLEPSGWYPLEPTLREGGYEPLAPVLLQNDYGPIASWVCLNSKQKISYTTVSLL